MANELKHKAVGTVLTQAEFEATDSHAFADQATGDILYASSTTQLRRLGIGSANEVLRTNAGATAPEWASTLSGLTLTNIAGEAGNDFGAAQLDLAADFTILGADGLNIDTTAGKLNLVPAGGIGLGGSAALGPKVRVYSNSTADYDFSGSFLDGAASQTNTITGDQAANFGWYLRSYTIAGDTGTRTVATAATVYIPDAPTVGANAAITYSHALWIDAGSARLDGAVFINDTANGNMTTGLTINMGAADNEILTLQSSDVGHSFTDLTEADTFGLMKKASASAGGLIIDSFIDTGANSFYLRGRAASVNTTKSISAYAPIHLQGSILATDTAGAVSENGNLVTIDNLSTVRFIFDAEGSGHADVEWVAYDSHDDLALMDAFQREATGRLTPMRYGDNPLYYARTYMEDIGIVGKDSWHTEQRPDGRVQDRQMVNFTKLAMLHHGAILQIGDAIKALEIENRELKALIGGQ